MQIPFISARSASRPDARLSADRDRARRFIEANGLDADRLRDELIGAYEPAQIPDVTSAASGVVSGRLHAPEPERGHEDIVGANAERTTSTAALAVLDGATRWLRADSGMSRVRALSQELNSVHADIRQRLEREEKLLKNASRALDAYRGAPSPKARAPFTNALMRIVHSIPDLPRTVEAFNEREIATMERDIWRAASQVVARIAELVDAIQQDLVGQVDAFGGAAGELQVRLRADTALTGIAGLLAYAPASGQVAAQLVEQLPPQALPRELFGAAREEGGEADLALSDRLETLALPQAERAVHRLTLATALELGIKAELEQGSGEPVYELLAEDVIQPLLVEHAPMSLAEAVRTTPARLYQLDATGEGALRSGVPVLPLERKDRDLTVIVSIGVAPSNPEDEEWAHAARPRIVTLSQRYNLYPLDALAQAFRGSTASDDVLNGHGEMRELLDAVITVDAHSAAGEPDA